MRLLIVIPDLAPTTGGPAVAVEVLVRALAERGLEVTVATTDFGLPPAPSLDGTALKTFPCRQSGRRWAPALGEFVRSEVERFDLTQIHTLWQYPTAVAARACFHAGVPYIVVPHGMLGAWSLSQKKWRKRAYLRLLEASTLRRAAAVLMTSDGEWRGSRPERWNPEVFVMPWGVRSQFLLGASESPDRIAEVQMLSGRHFVLFVGRLHPGKQPHVALRAFAAACPTDSTTCLAIAGPGHANDIRRLQSLAHEIGLADRVVFTGLLSAEALGYLYAHAAAFVLPSLHENFSHSLVEAMAAQCPAVVSDRLDLASDVVAAGAGLAVPPTVDATAEGLARVLGDDALARKMGENGRRLVLERFTWDRVATELNEVYEDILTGRRQSPAWRSLPKDIA